MISIPVRCNRYQANSTADFTRKMHQSWGKLISDYKYVHGRISNVQTTSPFYISKNKNVFRIPARLAFKSETTKNYTVFVLRQ